MAGQKGQPAVLRPVESADRPGLGRPAGGKRQAARPRRGGKPPGPGAG